MSHTAHSFGIAAELAQQRLTFFDTQTLAVLHQLNLDFAPLDVTITPNANWAVVNNVGTPILARINLLTDPPVVAGIQTLGGVARDVDITPDGLFVVAAADYRLYSYLIAKDLIVDDLETTGGTHVLAASPNGNGLILGDEYGAKTRDLSAFLIDLNGSLVRLNFTGFHNSLMTKIAFSADGNHAFVGGYSYVTVIDTASPNNITVGNQAQTNGIPFSFAVSRNGTTVYVLTYTTVDVFGFNAATGILTPVDSFQHGLSYDPVGLYTGIDYLGLDISETRLFLAGAGTLVAFTVTGQPLGSVAGVISDAGVALRQSAVLRGIKW